MRAGITLDRCKQLFVELVKVPSPQTELMENEPLLKRFITSEVEPRLRGMGISDIRYDGMGNLYSAHGAGVSGRSVMLITNAMNQPQATMKNAYAGDVVDGEPYDLPGEVVLGKGASEQKSNMAAMLIAMESVIASGVPMLAVWCICAVCQAKPASMTPSRASSMRPMPAPIWRFSAERA